MNTLDDVRGLLAAALAEREGLTARADDLVAAVETRGDTDLTDDEASKLDEIRSEIAQIDERLDALRADEQAAEARAERDAKAAELRARLGSVQFATGTPEKRSDWERFVSGELRSWHGNAETRDITTTTAAGSIPTNVYSSVTSAILDQSPILDLATRIDTAGGETIKAPTSTALTAAAVAEGGAIPESDPIPDAEDLTVAKYGRLLNFSTETLSDSAVDWVSWASRAAARAVGASFGAVVSAGVVTAATAGATPGAVSYAGLVDLFYSVQGPWRRNGTFVCNSTTAASIRKLTGSDGHGIWTAPMSAGEPEGILGRPLLTDDTIVDDGTVLFGDFEQSVIVRFAGGLRLERSADFRFGEDLVTWRMLLRAGSAVVDPAAVKKLTAV